jgi:hypothetical protein
MRNTAMDHPLIENRTLSFDSLNFKRAVPLPVMPDQVQHLQDISIVLSGHPSEDKGFGRIKVPLRDQDITKAVVDSLREKTRKADARKPQ